MEWTKKIIHLAGGEASLATRIFGYLGDMAEVIEESKMAAVVKTFQKVSNSPTQNPLSDNIVKEVDEGAAIMTFFGHSSAGTFDFSIEDPSQYKNGARMPVIVSLGCHSGNIHAPIFNPLGISENFVLQPEKGAIAFLASSGAAYLSPQYKSGLELYDNIGQQLYGNSLGDIVRVTLKSNFESASNAGSFLYWTETLTEQFTLHGDPAIVIPSFGGPDYISDFSTFNTIPENVTNNLDSFEVNFDIVNLGSRTSNILNGYIIHSFGSLKDTTSFSVQAPRNRGNYTFKLPTQGTKSIGKNSLEVILDPNDLIEELPDPAAENNNSLFSAYGEEGYCFFVFDNNAQPVYPPEFGIVNQNNFRLVGSASNALLPAQNYIIEIDTTETFDSALKQSTKLNSGGGIIEWIPDISLLDETVYYWRIATEDISKSKCLSMELF